MSPCVDYGDGLTVCRADNVLLHSEFEERSRWCFNCRRYVRYNVCLWGTIEPSYYEPVWTGECPNCGKDGASGGFWYVSWNDDGEFA